MDKNWTVAVTGAAGHVGSRLAETLALRGVTVRPLTRREGDVADRDAMRRALAGVDAAYYLVHSLASAGSFDEEERRGAREFAAAARECGVGRLVYLGGIVHESDLSPHLRSRREVGEILRASGVPTVELRASIVVGAGSASFDLVRTIVDRLPTPVAPDWLDHAAQPIALEDVVEYLVAALDVPLDGEAVYEIGGADRVRYRDLVNEVAEQLGRPKRAVTVPLPEPPLGVSQLPRRLAQLVPGKLRLAANLIESLQYDTDVRDTAALRDFPVRPRGLRDAVAAALAA
ncbi:MAG TPA: NAD-dependent epimerase/dehydratase family protein [Gaiellaceae bacterium]|nr:NAD-dependent epimerase/dehydratase family protein [Gaiellaceae bacterium]